MRESRGRSSETSFRLCSRAPRMMRWSATVVLRPVIDNALRWSRTHVRLDGVRRGQGDAPLQPRTHHRQRAHRPPSGVVVGGGTMAPVTDLSRLVLVPATSSRTPTRRSSAPSTAWTTRRTPSPPCSRLDPRPRGRAPRRSTPRASGARCTAPTSASRSRCTPRPSARDTDIAELAAARAGRAARAVPGRDRRSSPRRWPPCTRPTGTAASSAPPVPPASPPHQRAADAAARGGDPPRRPRRRPHGGRTGRQASARCCSTR